MATEYGSAAVRMLSPDQMTEKLGIAIQLDSLLSFQPLQVIINAIIEKLTTHTAILEKTAVSHEIVSEGDAKLQKQIDALREDQKHLKDTHDSQLSALSQKLQNQTDRTAALESTVSELQKQLAKGYADTTAREADHRKLLAGLETRLSEFESLKPSSEKIVTQTSETLLILSLLQDALLAADQQLAVAEGEAMTITMAGTGRLGADAAMVSGVCQHSLITLRRLRDGATATTMGAKLAQTSDEVSRISDLTRRFEAVAQRARALRDLLADKTGRTAQSPTNVQEQVISRSVPILAVSAPPTPAPHAANTDDSAGERLALLENEVRGLLATMSDKQSDRGLSERVTQLEEQMQGHEHEIAVLRSESDRQDSKPVSQLSEQQRKSRSGDAKKPLNVLKQSDKPEATALTARGSTVPEALDTFAFLQGGAFKDAVRALIPLAAQPYTLPSRLAALDDELDSLHSLLDNHRSQLHVLHGDITALKLTSPTDTTVDIPSNESDADALRRLLASKADAGSMMKLLEQKADSRQTSDALEKKADKRTLVALQKGLQQLIDNMALLQKDVQAQQHPRALTRQSSSSRVSPTFATPPLSLPPISGVSSEAVSSLHEQLSQLREQLAILQQQLDMKSDLSLLKQKVSKEYCDQLVSRLGVDVAQKLENVNAVQAEASDTAQAVKQLRAIVASKADRREVETLKTATAAIAAGTNDGAGIKVSCISCARGLGQPSGIPEIAMPYNTMPLPPPPSPSYFSATSPRRTYELRKFMYIQRHGDNVQSAHLCTKCAKRDATAPPKTAFAYSHTASQSL
eukprot:TRINITY_DN11018_c0_g1_i1.p1 TRINITY_DN11018_c0_g1~~TRINITY_DN11018_c0_g1_i1.p1  ORF type:complete len:817 (-),score=186.26 TRINITY_DN11018_c0_g1_i1:146-2557(-)